MKITDALYGEHGTLYALLAHCESSAPQWELADLLLAGRIVESVLLSHAAVEDELLFGALEERMAAGGPVAVMRGEHEEIDATLAGLRTLADEAAARRSLLHVVQVARDHFAKEEQVLFPLAEERVGEPELVRLGEEWAARRGVACGTRSPCAAFSGRH